MKKSQSQISTLATHENIKGKSLNNSSDASKKTDNFLL